MSTAIYDRQIRLWGLQTQSKISESRIFLYGYHSGLLEELAKDLVLTGVGTLVIGEYSESTEMPGSPNLVTYLGHDLNKLVEALSVLNPLAQIQTLHTYMNQRLLETDEEESEMQKVSRVIGTKAFGIFCLLCERFASPVAVALDRVCRNNNTLFIYSETVGALGYFILDLGAHYPYLEMNKTDYKTKYRATNKTEVIALDDSDSDTTQGDHFNPVLTERILEYPTLEEVFSNSAFLHSSNQKYLIFLAFLRKYKEQYYRTSQHCVKEIQKQLDVFLQHHKVNIRNHEMQSLYNFCSFMDVEMIAVSSCLAGIIGREIVKLISRNEQPIYNTFIFDAFSCIGSIIYVGSARVDRKRSRQGDADSVVFDI